MSPPTTPPIRQHTPFLTSIYYRLLALYLNWSITRQLSRFRANYPQWAAAYAPTFTKSYPILPGLEHRFFLPRSSNPSTSTSSTQTPRGLIVLLHGGGWVFGLPSMDDEQATLLSKRGYLVVSVAYRLAPRSRYTTQLTDIEAIIHCILSDSDLGLGEDCPLVIAGFSAGGVMALALAQLPSLEDRVAGVLSFFPRTDFTGRHTGEFRATPWGEEDVLTHTLGLFNWAYAPAGADLTDPRLSVAFATRGRRREVGAKMSVMLVTAERDCLADEGAVCAAGIAGRDTKDVDFTRNWEENGVRYLCVRDMPHSFTHFWVRPPPGEWAKRKEEAVRETWDAVGDWLEGVVPDGTTGSF